MDYVDLNFHQVVQLCHDVWGDSLSEAIQRADNFVDMTAYGKVIKSGSGFESTYQFPAQYWAQNELRAVGVTTNAGRASNAWTAYASTSGSAVSSTTGGATVAVKEAKSVTTGWVKKPATDLQRPSAYQASAILKMPLPSVAAAVAPLAGVAVGATMYNENPELWSKLSRALVPWAYPDNPIEEGFVDINKGLMPVWTDVAEASGELIAKALLPDFVVDAVKQLFEEEGIGGEGSPQYEHTYDLYPNARLYTSSAINTHNLDPESMVWQSITTTETTGLTDYFVFRAEGFGYTYVSRTPGTAKERWEGTNDTVINPTRQVTSQISVNGEVFYYGRSTAYSSDSWSGSPAPSTGLRNALEEAIDIYYNGNSRPIGSYYPTGTSPWGTGSVYPLPENPTKIVLQNDDGTERLIDAYPIPLPMTPGQSPDPSQQEIDDPIQDPTKQVDPYIQQTPDPYSDPAPSPDNPGQPDPRVDPSQPGEPGQPISPDSPTPDPPPSDGQTPDPIPPVIPPPFTSEGGLIAVYNPPQSTLVAFANWLWVTYQDATIQKIWNNPFDGVISLHELYCTPPVIGSRSIRSGFLDSEISSPIIGRYTEINCGNIVIPEYWGNYLDYAPYSKAFVYLPFIGIIELEADDIVGHAVNITYRVDCYNGSCIAMITVAKQGPDGSVYNNTVYQYSGNCAVELPLSGGSQANIKAAIINATAWGLGSVISGLVTAAGTGPLAGLAGAGQAITGALQATASVVNAKSSVQHSGTFGASFGAMGIKKPYIIVKRPIQVQVLNYNEIYGYQAHKAVTIGACEGYLRCREVHVTSATANDEEKQLIEQYLKTGVIV